MTIVVSNDKFKVKAYDRGRRDFKKFGALAVCPFESRGIKYYWLAGMADEKDL